MVLIIPYVNILSISFYLFIIFVYRVFSLLFRGLWPCLGLLLTLFEVFNIVVDLTDSLTIAGTTALTENVK